MSPFIWFDYGQASLVFSCLGVTNPIVTTFGFRRPTAPAPQDANTAALQIRIACSATGKWLHPSNYGSEWTFVRVDVTMGNGDNLQQGSSAAGDVGTMPSITTVPVNSAVLVRKLTANAGRKKRGRMYLPPMFFTESSVGPNGVIASAAISGLQTRLNTFLTDLEAAQYPMQINHTLEADEPTKVTGLAVQALLATQRRRMR